MGGLFGGGQQKVASSAPIVSGFRVQTSAYGRPIPIVYGKTRVAANVIWYGDFKSLERRSTQSAGGKGGGGGDQMETVSYSYQVAVALGLCEGPVTAICNTWANKLSGPPEKWNLSSYIGDYAQQPLGYLQTKHPEQALSYRGTAYVGTGVLDLGSDPTLPNMSFEVKGVAAHWGDSANPRDVVLDYCTNPNYGAGIPASKFGDLTRFSDFCVANGLFISPAYTEQEPAHEAMARLFKLTGSGAYYSEGKIKVQPYSDLPTTGNGVTFTPDLTPIYDLDDDDFLASNGEDPVQCERLSPSDAYNHIKLKFYNRDKGYNEDIVGAKDQASIEQSGLLRPLDVDMREIVDRNVARLVAQQILQRTLYIRNTYQFRLGWKFALLEPTDLVTLTDEALGLNRALVRITEIEEDEDGELMIKAEEVPVGSVGATRYPTQSSDGYTSNYNTQAGPINPPVIFEPPLALAGAPEIWIAVSGGESWGGCDIWVSDDNATYLRMGRTTGRARHGVLSAALASGAGVDTINPLAVDLSVSSGALLAATEENAHDLVTLCYADGELLAYRDATLTAPNQYQLGYLVRGAYGTVVDAHPVGSRFARLDQSIARFAYDKAKIGKTLYLKFQSFNIYGSGSEDLAALTPVTYQVTGSPLADVTGLQLEQPFIGKSCKIKWEAVDAAISYTVEVWAGTPQVLRRSVSVGDTHRYEYTWEDANADGGPWRQLAFKVRAISKTGASGRWASLVASNPVPATLTGVTASAGYNSVFFSCNSPAEPDVTGMRIWMSAISGFAPADANLVYDGSNWFTTLNKLTDGTSLRGNTPYYLRAAAYDSFGKTGLNIGSEVSVTPVTVSGGIKPGEIEAEMIKAVDAVKIAGTLQDWQLAGLQASKLLGQIQADQFGGKFGGGNLAQNSSFELNGGAPYVPYNNAGMVVSSSSAPGRAGGKALRIDFTGVPNNSQQGVYGPALKGGWLPNTTYVLSIYARAGGGHLGRGMGLRWNVQPAYTTTLLNPPLSDAWQRYAWRITWSGAVERSDFHLTSDEGGAARNGWFEFDDLQVELGDMLTQYNAVSQRIEKTEADTAGNAALISAEADARASAVESVARSVDQVNARMAPGGDVAGAIAGKAPQAALDAAVTRISNAETQLSGKAAAGDVLALTAAINRNLLDTSGWKPGAALPVGGFNPNQSQDGENALILGDGPFGEKLTILQGLAKSGHADGGWDYNNIPVDETQRYRLTVWMRPLAGNGQMYLGTQNVADIGGGPNGNPYFLSAPKSSFTTGRWYLWVGYVFPSSYAGPQLNLSGVYDGITGAKVATGTDYRLNPGAKTSTHRAYQFYSNDGAEQHFALPRFELCDGNEPTLAQLLAGATQNQTQAALSRVAQVESTVAGKANAQDVTTLTARVGDSEASVTQLQQAQAALDGKVSSKWGVVLDANGVLSGVQAFNDGRTSSFLITANQVAISPSNLIADPDFLIPSAWGNLVRGRDQNTDGAPSASYSRVAEFNGRDGYPSKRYQVAEGEVYRLRYYTRNGSNTTTGRGVFVSFGDAGGITTKGYVVTTPRAASTDWQLHEGSVTIPAGCTNIGVGSWIDQAHSAAATVWYCGLRMWRATDGNLLVDGAVTTDKVAANAVKARHIDTGDLVASSALVGQLTADQAFINQTRTAVLIADSVKASHIDSRELNIKDANGNILFGAGQNLNVGRITGLGSLATANGVAVGQVSGLGPLATKAQVAASDMAVGQLSAISANIGEISAGILYSNDRTRYFNLDPSRSAAMMYVPGAVQINFDGSGYFARTIVSAPDVRASGVAWVNSGWIGGSGSWTTYIDTGVNLPGGWSSSSSDMFQASATIAGGNSQRGGANGYSSVEVVHGDGLLSGAANSPIDNRMYIKFTWSGAGTSGGTINITRIDWKLVRV